MKDILLIQTGGTIAMDISREGQAPELDPAKWSEILHKEIPELSEIANIDIELLFFEDSSDIGTGHWSRLISFISRVYDNYSGFVILHGTDTLAFTASALSFGLKNLGKPVVLTGSQVPMSNIRSDARRNLVNSIEMATNKLNEVVICFNDHVYRGNRTTKMSIGDFDAFASPNYPPLGEIGLNIELNNSLPVPEEPLEPYTGFENRVFLLKLFPGLRTEFLDQLELPAIRALVIEAFGSGNIPVKGDNSLVPFFKKCIDNEIFLIITSQAPYDAVDLDTYESGRKAKELGALSAGDMTTEAVITKMMHLLENYQEFGRVKRLFMENLAGERSH